MIRYFGFLSNRRRGVMLPKVYEALDMEERSKPALPGFASMLKAYVKIDPFECILGFCYHPLEIGIRDVFNPICTK
jgi:hypothetical protein